ncbi:MAG TPA: hypothetical protein DCE41_31300, partial [Cytophagales bacterium]|nr:hypothetical protein [Cytophagales bacterium]
MKKKLFLLAAGALMAFHGQAQESLSVNPVNGAASLSIPLWELQDHDISTGVSLVYQANGVRVKQTSGLYGLGWDLAAAGSITREVRDLPDDTFPITENGVVKESRQGWLANTTGADVHTLLNGLTVNTDANNCTGESLVHQTLKAGYLDAGKDAEPDIFRFSVPGYSGSFYFDQYGAIQMLPHQSMDITYQWTANLGITSFTITTPEGTEFTFGRYSRVQRKTKLNEEVTAVKYFYREYAHYKVAKYYNTEWHLTSMSSRATGASFSFGYLANSRSWEDPHEVVVAKANGDYTKVSEFTTTYNATELVLSHIQASNQSRIKLVYSGSGYEKVLSSILIFDRYDDTNQVYVHNRQFDLGYRNLSTSNLHLVSYHRNFLATLTESAGCEVRNPYEFHYWGVDLENYATILTDPRENENREDVWGFFNNVGSSEVHGAPALYVKPNEPDAFRYHTRDIPNYTDVDVPVYGRNRESNPEVIMVGTLDQVKSPEGGVTTLTYEAHEYQDPITGETVQGGGIRVKSIRTSDGLGGENDIVETYSYQDGNGHTAGKVAYLPQFVIPTGNYKDPETEAYEPAKDLFAATNTQSAWGKLIVRSETNLAPTGAVDGSNVGYTQVTHAVSGAGSTVYSYDLPAMYGDGAYNGTEWTPTTGYVVRNQTVCEAIDAGSILTGNYTYPYLPYADFGYARGQLLAVRLYNETGQMVQEQVNTYQDVMPQLVREEIQGMFYQYDVGSSNLMSNLILVPYLHHAAVKKSLASTVTRTYDPNNYSASTETTTTYTYGSSQHTFLTQIATSYPDGSETLQELRYPQDYGLSLTGNADADAAGIIGLINQHRVGIPLEVLYKAKSYGDAQLLQTQASFRQYQNRWINDAWRPQNVATYRLVTQQPLTSATGVTSSTSGSQQTISIPGNYLATQEIVAFTTSGMAETQYDPLRKVYSGIHWGYQDKFPVATMAFGHADEVVFSDFESELSHGWSMSFPDLYHTASQSHTGYFSYQLGLPFMGQNPELSATVTHRGGERFLLSGYINTSEASTATLTLSQPNNGPPFHTQTFAIPNTQGEWQYWEALVEEDAWPANTPNYQVKLSGLLGYLDNLAWHPERVNFTFNSFNESRGLVAESDGNGLTTFYERDELGRILRIRDQEGNIVQNYQYQDINQANAPTATFAVEGTAARAGEPTTLRIVDGCWENASYTWTLGGNTPVTTTD